MRTDQSPGVKMAEATVTVEIGAQSSSFTIPDAAVQRIIPMVNAEWRQHHPGDDPTTLQIFAAGLKNTIRRALLRYEKQSFIPDPVDMGTDPESK
jgi:hypothetical protein